MSPNDSSTTKKMRSDLERIKKMIDEISTNWPLSSNPRVDEHEMLKEENAILRELLTSWQALTANEYQTDVKLHLNMLTKRMLNE